MPRQCQGYTTNCRNCNIKVPKNEEHKVCPECGEDLRCRNEVEPGYEGCRYHGGPNPEHGFYGPGPPARTGTYSRFPVLNLAAKYHEIIQNPHVVSIRHALFPVRARIWQLFGRLEENETPQRMARILTLWDKFTKLAPLSTLIHYIKPEAVKAWNELNDEFERTYHDYASWEQIFKAIDMERKLVESELKVIKEIRATLTAEEAYDLIAQMLAAIMEVVNDPQQLKALQYRFIRIVGDDNFIESRISSEEIGAGAGRSGVDAGAPLDS